MIRDALLNEAIRLTGQHKFDEAEEKLALGLTQIIGQDDLEALYFTWLGAINRYKGDIPKSYDYYQKAEAYLPEDPNIKVIVANILCDHFKKYDQAIKKLNEALKLSQGNELLNHHAQVALGLNYLAKNQKVKAVNALKLASQFSQIGSSVNINLRLVEALLNENEGLEVCKNFLKKALSYANALGESAMTRVFDFLLNEIDTDKKSRV